MDIKKEIKKYLCRTGSYYEDGKLVVPAAAVILYGLMGLILGGFVIGAVVQIIWYLFTDPMKALEAIGVIIGVLAGIGFTFWIFAKFLSWSVLTALAKRFEVTCDRVVFPENVKTIFAQIEGLDEEGKILFSKGIYPLLRKWGDD